MGFLINAVVLAVLLLYPAWRIFGRAGFHPALSLLILIPTVGWLIVLFILAFVAWPANRRRVKAGGDA